MKVPPDKKKKNLNLQCRSIKTYKEEKKLQSVSFASVKRNKRREFCII
jgi:hypothetical protein